jgi:hypothetical protein
MKWGIKSIVNERPSNGAPIQMKSFLLPYLAVEEERESEIKPKKKDDRPITNFPTAFPIPFNIGSKSTVLLYIQKVAKNTTFRRMVVPKRHIP